MAHYCGTGLSLTSLRINNHLTCISPALVYPSGWTGSASGFTIQPAFIILVVTRQPGCLLTWQVTFESSPSSITAWSVNTQHIWTLPWVATLAIGSSLAQCHLDPHRQIFVWCCGSRSNAFGNDMGHQKDFRAISSSTRVCSGFFFRQNWWPSVHCFIQRQPYTL